MKVNHQDAYVLHRYPYSESSLLVEVFTQSHGRLMLIAKGARRLKSPVRGVLIPFKHLIISWSGKGQLPILTSAECRQFTPDLEKQRLHSGLYINELILKLLHRFDPHQELFAYYQKTVNALVNESDPALVLRVFEKRLLQEIGFGLILDHEVDTGEIIDRSKQYQYLPQKGPVESIEIREDVGVSVSGATLEALRSENFNNRNELKQARLLNRNLLMQQLHFRELRSRKVLMQVMRYTS